MLMLRKWRNMKIYLKSLAFVMIQLLFIRNENASLISKVKELNVCNDSISCLRDENVRLNAKIE